MKNLLFVFISALGIGYSFSQKQSSEFKSFVDYIDTKSKEQETESFTDIIKIVIEAIKNNDKKL